MDKLWNSKPEKNGRCLVFYVLGRTYELSAHKYNWFKSKCNGQEAMNHPHESTTIHVAESPWVVNYLPKGCIIMVSCTNPNSAKHVHFSFTRLMIYLYVIQK